MPLIPSLRRQLSNFLKLTHKLQRLTQPYFLPLEETDGWQFLGLLVALIFCVGGVVLFLLTALMAAVHGVLPQLTDTYLGGVEGWLRTTWSSWWGVLFCGLFAAGCLSFFAIRRQLRRRRWLPWLLLGVIVFMLLAVNGINAGIGFIARDLTNALIGRDPETYGRNIWIYVICLIVALPIRTSQVFFAAKLGILWREWLSKSLVTDYMTDRAYYRINPNDEQVTDIDNPDQRISEDTKDFTAQTLAFTVSTFDAILAFSLNIFILWNISKSLTLVTFVYTLISSIILIISSRKLVKLNFNQSRYEADFRYGLVHVRDNAESIAFYRGEQQEQKETERRLGIVVKNFNLLIIWQTIIAVMQRSSFYGSYLIPYLILSGPILLGEMEYGEFSQAHLHLSQVESALFFIVFNIDSLARFSASIGRLAGFQANVEEAVRESRAARQAIPSGDGLVVRHATLATPQTDRVLIEDLSLSVSGNEHLLVVGPSGCGKTSLLRMVSGLWSPREGTVESPQPGELLFIPQKPYMTLGTLREQLCYPQPPDPALFSDDHLRSVLELVNLAALVQRYPDFNVKQDWPRLLSLGEQQRLAFARLLLNSPRYVVLDEATSAVDVKTERHLYNLLAERNIAFISVGHRPTLTAFHDNVLELDGSGSWRLIPAGDYGTSPA